MAFRIAFAGTPAFTLPTLEALCAMQGVEVPYVLTQSDKPVGRKKELQESPVATFARQHKIQVFKCNHLSDIREELLSHEIDLVVVIAYGVLFPQWFLDHPAHGCINIHYSKLPDLRGASPIQSALLQGYSKTGISVFKLVSKMDAGDIVYQEDLRIDPHHTFTDVLKQCETLTPGILKNMLIPYLKGAIVPIPQDHTKATFCYTITKNDGRIDWNKDSAEAIYNKYRAFVEWPGIWTTWNGEMLKLVGIKPTLQEEGTPGRIIMDEERLFVGTTSTDIEILTLQKAGKKVSRADVFLKGYLTSISKYPFLV